ncbi:hypothetical protein CNECB9_2550014 [Cupriavidus necator]|uniref:Uncharacterized protein n=1 Tax=Cupriavidus necator TaxID=106590 RepID=A0A1K0ISG7_CUPNE|nr:hypothetical protein CNECB9_2550014 [Cupriavidus necator]
MAIHLDARAQVAAGHGAGHVHGALDRPRDSTRDQQAANNSNGRRYQGNQDQQVALALIIGLQPALHLLLARQGELGVGVGRLDQRRQQGAALLVDTGHGFLDLALHRQADDARGDRAVLGLDLHHILHQLARVVADAGLAHHLGQPRQPCLHVLVRAQGLGLFALQLARVGHQHQVARRDGTPVHRAAHLRGHVRAGIQPVQVVIETCGRIAERMQRIRRHHQHHARQRAEPGQQPRADRQTPEVHDHSPSPSNKTYALRLLWIQPLHAPQLHATARPFLLVGPAFAIGRGSAPANVCYPCSLLRWLTVRLRGTDPHQSGEWRYGFVVEAKECARSHTQGWGGADDADAIQAHRHCGTDRSLARPLD